jgi:HlyD family secretion protein
MKRLLRLLLVIILVAAAAISLRMFLTSRPVEAEVARPESDIAVRVFGLGTQEARIATKLGFETQAALVEARVDHGDRVKAGDLLARLDEGEARARLDKSQAGVAAAEAALAKSEALAARAQVVAQQKRRVDERRRSLVQRQTVSIEAAEQAELDARVAEADAAVAERDIEASRVALTAARAQAALDGVLLERHRLRAPFDGVVIARHRELGAVMNPGEALFTLVDPTSVWIQAFVDEARAGGLAADQAAEVRLRSRPDRAFTGRVARVGLENDRVGEERRVYVACDDCPSEFHLGEQAEVVVTTGRLARALLVPETALRMVGPAEAVGWVVADGRLKETRLGLGARLLDGRIEVIEGLPDGARVVTSKDAGGFRDGRAARLASPEATP